MSDREKVIKGLRMCKYIRCESKDCPYYEFVICREVLHRHALALIRELKSKADAYDQMKWERDIAVGQLEQIGKSLGEKMDDVKNILARNAEISESKEADDGD